MKKRSRSRSRSRVKRNDGQPLWVLMVTTIVICGLVYLFSIPSGDQLQGSSGFFGLK